MVEVNEKSKLVFDLVMSQIDYNEQKKESLRVEIANKYGVPLKNVHINFVPVNVDEDGNSVALTSDIIENIQDPKFQQKLFKEYIDIKKIENVDFDAVIAIDNEVNSHVDFDAYSKYKNYKFKYVKWDNYLSYGKGNYFDFTKLHGLVLLNGYPENQCGKTTFAIDLMRFALFGKAEKSPTLDSVFNIYKPEETEVMVEVCLEIDGIDYVIRRTVTRPQLSKRTKKSKCKQKVEYFRLNNGEYESMEAESTTQTNNVIKDIIGSVDDFNLVISATSFSLGELLRKGQSEKGKIFSRWLGLQTLEQKDEVAKKLYKEKIQSKLLSNTYNKESVLGEIKDAEDVISADKKDIIEAEKAMKETESRITQLENDKKIELAKKREVKESLVKLDVTTIEKQIENTETELTDTRNLFKAFKVDYMKIKDVVYDKEAHAKIKSDIDGIKNRQTELRVNISHLREENKRIQSLIDGKTCPTCGQSIDNAKQGKAIEENNIKIKEYTDEGIQNKAELTKKEAEEKEIAAKNETVNERQKLELKLVAMKTSVENLKLNLEKWNKQKQEVEDNKENIRINNEIDLNIGNIDISLSNERKIKEDKIRLIENLKSEITNMGKEIDKRKELINKLTDEEAVIRNWAIYQELVGKNGIIKLVLRRALPVINNELKRLLNGLCDFNVVLSISDDNKEVLIDLYRDGKQLDLGTCGSGFESTISALALRSALAGIATMAKPSMLVLDEILSGVSESNFDNIRELYSRILGNYDFILHICHIPEAEPWHDQIVTVVKRDNVSVIEFNDATSKIK